MKAALKSKLLIKGVKKMCVFCKIIKGEIPSYKIYEDENTYAFLDIADDTVGHTLVIPKKHYENVMETPNEELTQVMNTVKKIAEHYTTNCGYTGVNIMNASGVDAQQSVFHLHFHIFPRKTQDGVNAWPEFGKVNQNFEKVCQELTLMK